ncbi:oxidoreductase [Haloarchaeobius iranensis]|uniref:Trimethylamine dehydrogenase apoprotein n=1 Tax=Haloarchaeobius iranensis TaxID=996166 RepID=A0A1G9Z9Q2_9EURY|nr:FAD-dependent oxidoreductase [Haloarchaeobius iranensis]SDN18089.1 trimethylamine dehydrogenase apoprotein [Haloarchaeobius iranensis]
MTNSYDALFEPLELGPVEIPNRVYQPPHGNAYGLGDQQTAFRAEKAKGGFGLIIQEYSQIHESTDVTPVDPGFLHTDETIEPQREMVEAVHDHGSKLFVELWHGGLTASNYGSRHPPLSSSQTPSGNYYTPKEMEHEDIREIVEAFGTAADRARRAGYDGVELHAAHGYLISQFLSPFYNDRDDEYGGSLENRMRFFEEVIDSVDDAIGDEMAFGARFTIDERVEGGLTADGEGLEIVERVGDDLDFWDLDIGVKQSIDDMIGPSRRHSKNYQIEFIEEATEVLDVPVGGTGRITDPRDAERLLESGSLDMVGMARQSIADPHWPKKAREGRVDQIRECIGCNICVSQSRQGIPLICTQNPTVGEEQRWGPEAYEQVDEPKGILVVGGGPAGTEFARVAAERGHIVHLNEKERELGGRVNFEGSLPGLSEWKRVRDWRETELDRLDVAVHTGSRAEMEYDDVRTYGAEVVVIATGGHWSEKGVTSGTHQPVPGWDQDHVLTPKEAVDADLSDERVVIFDEEGYNVSAGVAQTLAEDNDLTFVTPRTSAFQEALHTFERKTIYSDLYSAGVDFVPDHTLTQVGEGTVTATNVYSDEATMFDADYVVFTTMRKSNDGLYRELKANEEALTSETEIEEVHAIGDCVSPRRIADAIYHGHELGRQT